MTKPLRILLAVLVALLVGGAVYLLKGGERDSIPTSLAPVMAAVGAAVGAAAVRRRRRLGAGARPAPPLVARLALILASLLAIGVVVFRHPRGLGGASTDSLPWTVLILVVALAAVAVVVRLLKRDRDRPTL